MDIEEKLKRLKKERELRTRSRSQKIEETWGKISRDEALSVKEKLQKLIHLTDGKKEKRKEKDSPEAILKERREPFLFFENPYPLQTKYGKNRLSDGLDIRGEILSTLSKDITFKGLDLSTALFIDLETTGLSGGTGTVPFLVGMGYYQNERFHVAQYFLGELAEEERIIQELVQFFAQMNFQSVVTYNGKSFDIPLLETRFILNRQPFSLSKLPHLDFLFTARNLWKHKHESCRLFHLAQQIVEADRAEDIPSAEIPHRYFEYLQSGDFGLIEPILYHNQEDILSLLGLIITASKLFSEEYAAAVEGEVDALDLFGVGKVLESAGDANKSTLFFQRALEGQLPDELALHIKKKLSYHYKKNADWEKAVSLWQQLTSVDQLFCFRELAMYFEHMEKKYEEARRFTEQGLALSMNLSLSYQKDFSRRLERLNKKIRKCKEGAVKK
ncbi:MAG: ribonuclease H-like domain-containing protein [Candidatus Aminicenantales bacterium]